MSKGGSIKPITVVTDADLRENGGRYVVGGGPALPVFAFTEGDLDGDDAIEGGALEPIYVVRELNTTRPLGGGEAEKVVRLRTPGRAIESRVAQPVFVVPESPTTLEGADLIDWIIRDDFTAPEVQNPGTFDGSPANPGGGVRNIVDTGNNMSIAGGGELVIGAGAGGDDPADGYTPLFAVRTVGQMLFMSYNRTAGGNVGWGWGATLATNAIEGFNKSGGDILGRSRGVAPIINMGPVTDGVDVLTMVAFANAKHDMFVFQNGVWKLFYIRTGILATPINPIADVFGAGAVTFSFQHVRVPVDLWLPVPLASDGFGGAAATTDGLGHTEGVAGGIGSGGGGVAWNVQTFTNAGGQALNTPGESAEQALNFDFTAWTLDDPDNWTVSPPEDANMEVCEVGAGEAHANCGGAGVGYVNVWWSGGPGVTSISQLIMTVGQWYVIRTDIDVVTAGSIRVADLAGGISQLYNTPGNKILTGRAGSGTLRLRLAADPSDVTVDSISVKELTLVDLFKSLTISTSDVISTVEISVDPATTQAGLVLNLDDETAPANFVICYHDGANVLLEKAVAGIYTTLVNVATAFGAGDELRVIKDGTAYRVYYADVLIGTTTIADAGIVDNVLHGLFSTNSVPRLDDFTLYARGVDGEYSNLNAYVTDDN